MFGSAEATTLNIVKIFVFANFTKMIEIFQQIFDMDFHFQSMGLG